MAAKEKKRQERELQEQSLIQEKRTKNIQKVKNID